MENENDRFIETLDTLLDEGTSSMRDIHKRTAESLGDALLKLYDMLWNLDEGIWNLQNTAEGAFFNAKNLIIDLYENARKYLEDYIEEGMGNTVPRQNATYMIGGRVKRGFNLVMEAVSFAKEYIEGVMNAYEDPEGPNSPRNPLDV